MGQGCGVVVKGAIGGPLRLEYVGEVKDEDDRDRNADGPGENTFHWGCSCGRYGWATRVGVGWFHGGVGCAFIAHHFGWRVRCAMNAHPTMAVYPANA